MPHVMLGLALEESGDFTGALTAYRGATATSAEPGNPEAAYLIERLSQFPQMTCRAHRLDEHGWSNTLTCGTVPVSQ